MNELFMRAPCFGGRGLDSSEYLTLPEREWWTRASAAISLRNVKEALKLVQESRNGRQIRGFILDEELALLDKNICEIMEEYQLGIWSKSTDRLALDTAEREKLKSTMLIEKELLLSCAASPPVKTGDQKQNMTTQLDLQDKSVARTTRSLDHSPIISTDTGTDRNEDTVACKTQNIVYKTASVSMTTQLDLLDKSVARTPRSLDRTPIISTDTGMDWNEDTVTCRTQNIVDKTASISMTTQLDLQDKSVARTPRSIDHTLTISTETNMDKNEETASCKTQSNVDEIASIGFQFFAKIFRSIGSCVCCGRRRAATEEY